MEVVTGAFEGVAELETETEPEPEPEPEPLSLLVPSVKTCQQSLFNRKSEDAYTNQRQ
jgi:hypothetical protein